MFERLKVLYIHISYSIFRMMFFFFLICQQTWKTPVHFVILCASTVNRHPVFPYDFPTEKRTVRFAVWQYTATCQSIKWNVRIEFLLVNIYASIFFFFAFVHSHGIEHSELYLKHESRRVKYAWFLFFLSISIEYQDRQRFACSSQRMSMRPNSHILICLINIFLIAFANSSDHLLSAQMICLWYSKKRSKYIYLPNDES